MSWYLSLAGREEFRRVCTGVWCCELGQASQEVDGGERRVPVRGPMATVDILGALSGRFIARMRILGRGMDPTCWKRRDGAQDSLPFLERPAPPRDSEFDTPKEEMGNAGRSRPNLHHAYERS
jgi:hypothetical protein